MYSDGIFDSPERQVHSEIPDEVYLLENFNEIENFLASPKNLALGRASYPKGYDDKVGEWIAAGTDLDVDFKSMLDLIDLTSPQARYLMQPILPLCKLMERQIPGTKSLTLGVVRDQMCPLFHVDRVFARIIVTLSGNGTQWLQEKDVLRKNLGKGGRKPVAKTGSYLQEILERQVAVLKGSLYQGSKGLVHRSPPVDPKSEPRLFLRIDFR